MNLSLSAGPMRTVSSKGFVSRKRNYFDKLTLLIWFLQLVVSFAVALS
jgi:hypothetical protein